MRILNRPMFRYGGPIKEGVMSGMRSNHANGGTIAGGNQIGMPMGNRTGFADPGTPGFWTKRDTKKFTGYLYPNRKNSRHHKQSCSYNLYAKFKKLSWCIKGIRLG